MGGKPVHATEREEEGKDEPINRQNLSLPKQHHEGSIRTRAS